MSAAPVPIAATSKRQKGHVRPDGKGVNSLCEYRSGGGVAPTREESPSLTGGRCLGGVHGGWLSETTFSF